MTTNFCVSWSLIGPDYLGDHDYAYRTEENFHINQSINLNELKDKNNNLHVLVVDDICDTGDTMKHVTKQLALGNIPYTTACICTKEKFTHWLDHYGTVVPDNRWVVFPWE